MDHYKFTPEQVTAIVQTLMQFEAAKVYDTIKMLDNEIVKQNHEREQNAQPVVE